MSEKEKDVIRRISDAVPKLDKEKQNYVLGIVDGMALMKEARANQDTARTSQAV